MHGRFDAHQPHAAPRGGGDGRPELRREAGEFRHHRAPQPLARPESEDLLRCRIRVQQPAVRVHGDHARPEVAQNVVRLELHLAHFGCQCFALRAHDVHPAGDVAGHHCDENEDRELDPDACGDPRMPPEDVGEVDQAGEQRDEPGIRRRHQQRRDGDEDDVEAGEIAFRAARHVDDRGNQDDIEQRLQIEEGRARQPTADMGVPVGGGCDARGGDQQQGRNQDVERGCDSDLQGGGDVDGDRQAHPPHIDEAEELGRGRNRRPLRFDAQPAHGGPLLDLLWQNARAGSTKWAVGRLGRWAVGRFGGWIRKRPHNEGRFPRTA